MRKNLTGGSARAWSLGLGSALLIVVAVCGPGVGVLSAQSSLTPEQLEQLQDLSPAERLQLLERYRASQSSGGAEAVVDSTSDIDDRRVPRPIGLEAPTEELGRRGGTESDEPATRPEAQAVTTTLPRFGQELFEQSPATFDAPRFGPVPGDYRLGPGDELVVEVWGEVSFRDRYTVSREGSVLLRDAGRADVVGKTLAEAEREIVARFSRVLSGVRPDGGGSTFVDVGLGRLRAIRVFVVGEARRPGGYEVSSASTVFQALYAAGGPSPLGSMRHVELIRGNRTHSVLDLYEYLTQGRRSGDVVLQDGDTIFLPVASVVVSLRGEVRREARYELKAGEGLRDAIAFAGGLAAAARSDIAHVRRLLSPQQRVGSVVQRVDLDLSLAGVFDPSAPVVALNDQDIVTVLPINPREEAFVSAGGSVVLPGRYGWREGLRVSDLLESAGGMWRDALREHALLVRMNDDYTRESFPLDLSDLRPESVQDYLLAPMDSLHVFSREVLVDERSVEVHGDVRRPGAYPYFDRMTLRDVVLAAGGTLESADPLSAEVSRLDPASPLEGGRLATSIEVPLGIDGNSTEAAEFELMNHDHVFVRRQPAWELQRNVQVDGEVLYPGTYTMLDRDERLSRVIERAGGLLPTAFPEGFRLARDAGGVGNIGLDLADALENPGGVNDIVLVAGDRITVPAVPNSVKVVGEVGFPTSVVFEKGRSIGDYISLAGGYTADADEGRSKVVYPNGLSKKVRKWWFDPGVQPGSMIFVPRKDPEAGVDWGDVVVRTTQVLSSLATIYLVVDRASE